MIEFLIKTSLATWDLLLDSSVYILFGLLISGFLSVFLSPSSITKHLGKGRFLSVFKAAIFGIPLPLCSCGVLPAAVSLKKQGANNGATTAFLIATPESGVDSISISYALLDPILTVARPFAAFVTAMAAGITDNISNGLGKKPVKDSDENLKKDIFCNTKEDTIDINKSSTLMGKIVAGFKHAYTDVWSDLAFWFFIGLLLAGLITSLVPEELFGQYLSGGFLSMLIMLVVGIPLYICATASTPIAAALIMKGVSPGAALVFLLAGPATNVTTLTVLTGVLGKKTTTIYLGTIALFSILFGLAVDSIYLYMSISPQAIVGKASEMVPFWVQLAGTIILLAISIKPLHRDIKIRLNRAFVRIKSGSKGGIPGDSSQDTVSCAGYT